MPIKSLFALPMLLYVASVVVVNIGFSYVPPIDTPFGLFSPMAIVVGAIFVLRDFAQRAAGHGVLAAMAVATVLSYLLADPYVATASAAAFIASELIDYAVYTIVKKRGGTFQDRILVSSIVSTPVDTAVFLIGISFLSFGTFCLMVASKMIAAVALYVYYGMTDTFKELDPYGINDPYKYDTAYKID